MGLKNILLFLLLCLSHTIQGQSLINIFRNEIPDTLLKNPSFLRQTNAAMEFYSKLNPSLIGYQIMHLKARYGSGITNEDSNYFNILTNAMNVEIDKRNKWLENEIKLVNENISHGIKASEIISILEDDSYKQRRITESSLTVLYPDSNFNFYCLYKFLKKDSSLMYDRDLDYQNQIYTASLNLTIYLEKLIHTAENLPYSHRSDIINTISQYYWVFKDSYGPDNLNKIKYHGYESIEKCINAEYICNEQYGIFIGGTYWQETLTSDFQFSENLSPTETISFDGKISTRHENYIYAGLSYRMSLNDLKSFFSFIDFRISVGVQNSQKFSSSIPETKNGQYIVKPDSGIIGYLVNSDYAFELEPDFRSIIAHAQITTPFIYVLQELHFEVGLHYSLIQRTISASLSRNDKYVFTPGYDPSRLSNYRNEYTLNKIKHIFRPVFGIAYNFSETILVNCRFIPLITTFEISYYF